MGDLRVAFGVILNTRPKVARDKNTEKEYRKLQPLCQNVPVKNKKAAL